MVRLNVSVLSWLGAGAFVFLASRGFAQDAGLKTPSAARPFGLEKRVPWTRSRITGSPEPPSPYAVERAFPKLQFVEPVELVSAPGSGRLFLIQLKGKIVSFPPNPECDRADLLIDLKELHPELTMTYGIAFHPKFPENRFVYICYVLKDDDPAGSRVSRFTVANLSPPRIDPQSEVVVITWLGGGHNGGSIHFGKDGYLYISTGDGRGPDPPDILNTGQDISDLLSSVLRIDVDRAEGAKPYRVPPDNPFIGTPGARPEVWCYGLRNPWRMSFDSVTGDLWVGDVGWELWEMIYLAQRGANYGWSVIEGKQIVKPDGKRGPTPIVPPTMIHPHSEAASITGGYVYHGKRLRDLEGAYIYGDYETGKIWALRHQNGEIAWQRELVDTAIKIAAFGTDHSGELYIVDHVGGGLHRLTPNAAADSPSTFPRKLSGSGLFTDVARHRVAPGVVPFSVNAELWNDNGVAERFVALPGESTILTSNSPWQYPKDAVLAKTISLEMESGKPASRRRIETQVLHFNGDSWNAYTYRWNDQQTDAELLDKSGSEQTFAVKDSAVPGGSRQQTWRFHSRAECLRCHNSWCGTALGFHPLQLNGELDYAACERDSANSNKASRTDNQLRTLAHIGILDRDLLARTPLRVVNPKDRSANLTERARSYLHANCSHCHREHAGGSVLVFMNYDAPLEKAGLIGAKPTQGSFGITGARVVAPGDPCRSVLLYRVSKLGRGHMPYLGSSVIDVELLRLLHDWITGLSPAPAAEPEQAQVAQLRAEEQKLMQQLAAPNGSPATDALAAIDRLLGSANGALRLLHAIDEAALDPAVKKNVLAKGIAQSDPVVRDLFERFVPEDKRIKTLGTDIDPESILALKGDVERGGKLFFQEGGAQCYTCHRINGQGRDFGADLGHIGQKYNRRQLLEHILEPSKFIDPKFAAVTVETKTGVSHTGFIVRKTSAELGLRTANADEVVVPASDVNTVEPQRLSLMPEQLLQSLTAQQAADLIEFLQSLR